MWCKYFVLFITLGAAACQHVKLSENVAYFFGRTLSRCTIHIVFDTSSNHGESLIGLPDTSLVSQVLSGPFLFSNYDKQNITKTIWWEERHSFCYTYLYFGDFTANYVDSIITQHLFMYNAYPSPDFIVFWDISEVYRERLQFARRREFYTYFDDYRLLIRFNSNSSSFEISLLCTHCDSAGIQFYENYLNGILPTASNIYLLWKELHGNWLGKAILVCWKCPFLEQSLNPLKPFVHDVLKDYLNASIWYEFYPGYFYQQYKNGPYHHGLIAYEHEGFWAYSDAETLLSDLPMFSATHTGYFQEKQFYMLTVIKKLLLARVGWAVVFLPLETFVWSVIAAFVILIFLILRKLEKSTAFIDVICLFAPLTDQWFVTKMFPWVERILVLWSVLCFSLTVLYGGELASSMSTLTVPWYPATIWDLEKSQSNLMSTASVKSVYEDESTVAYLLHAALPYDRRKGRWSDIIDGIMTEFCVPDRARYNNSNPEAPFTCLGVWPQIQYNKPVTFIDSEFSIQAAKATYENSELFWVGSRRQLPELRFTMSLLVSRNFFSKLAIPIVRAWWAGGLEDYSIRVQDKSRLSKQNVPLQVVHAVDSSTGASVIGDFKPMQLPSLASISRIMICFVGLIVFGVMYEHIPFLTLKLNKLQNTVRKYFVVVSKYFATKCRLCCRTVYANSVICSKTVTHAVAARWIPNIFRRRGKTRREFSLYKT